MKGAQELVARISLVHHLQVTELELAGMDVTKSTDPLEQTRADYVRQRDAHRILDARRSFVNPAA